MKLFKISDMHEFDVPLDLEDDILNSEDDNLFDDQDDILSTSDDDFEDDILSSSEDDILSGDEDITNDDQSNSIDDDSLDNENSEESSDYEGVIRNVKGAYLIYKRKQEDDTYEELWIYNTGKDMKKESQIRRAILSGTDIEVGNNESKNGIQKLDSYTVGNVSYLKINGQSQ